MSSEKLIANELLGSTRYRCDAMYEDNFLQICKANYKEEEIIHAKVLLYQRLSKADRMPTRRWDEKARGACKTSFHDLKRSAIYIIYKINCIGNIAIILNTVSDKRKM